MSVTGPTERRQYGDYEIESLLGKGSIGKVYLARHRRINRKAALKVIPADQHFEDDADRQEFYSRLQREAELCGALLHPNIVTLYEVGYEKDVVSFFASEYVSGESLHALLKRTRPLPLEQALSIARGILRGLAYAHGYGIVHRDIKPANILISPDGTPKITDFGIARPEESSLTGINSLLGTPNYMSPEQVKSAPVSPRSDLFSAGVVMYEMLTGVRPFGSSELSGVLFNVVNLDPPSVSEVNAGVPAAVSRIVTRLMAKSPADRYASAADALAELEALPPVVNAPPSEYGTIAVSGSENTTPLPTIVDAPSEGHGGAAAAQAAIEESNRTTVRTNVFARLFTRDIPAAVFWPFTLALLIAFSVTVLIMQAHIRRQKPSAVITQEQMSTAMAKRNELAAARAFVSAGKYDEAIRRYDAYLAKYPDSITAQDERDEALDRLEKSRKATAQVTTTAARPHHRAAKKPSRWERVKRWFRGP